MVTKLPVVTGTRVITPDVSLSIYAFAPEKISLMYGKENRSVVEALWIAHPKKL